MTRSLTEEKKQRALRFQDFLKLESPQRADIAVCNGNSDELTLFKGFHKEAIQRNRGIFHAWTFQFKYPISEHAEDHSKLQTAINLTNRLAPSFSTAINDYCSLHQLKQLIHQLNEIKAQTEISEEDKRAINDSLGALQALLPKIKHSMYHDMATRDPELLNAVLQSCADAYPKDHDVRKHDVDTYAKLARSHERDADQIPIYAAIPLAGEQGSYFLVHKDIDGDYAFKRCAIYGIQKREYHPDIGEYTSTLKHYATITLSGKIHSDTDKREVKASSTVETHELGSAAIPQPIEQWQALQLDTNPDFIGLNHFLAGAQRQSQDYEFERQELLRVCQLGNGIPCLQQRGIHLLAAIDASIKANSKQDRKRAIEIMQDAREVILHPSQKNITKLSNTIKPIKRTTSSKWRMVGAAALGLLSAAICVASIGIGIASAGTLAGISAIGLKIAATTGAAAIALASGAAAKKSRRSFWQLRWGCTRRYNAAKDLCDAATKKAGTSDLDAAPLTEPLLPTSYRVEGRTAHFDRYPTADQVEALHTKHPEVVGIQWLNGAGTSYSEEKVAGFAERHSKTTTHDSHDSEFSRTMAVGR